MKNKEKQKHPLTLVTAMHITILSVSLFSLTILIHPTLSNLTIRTNQ